MKNIGLYIHIPFCKAKCLYCDFNSYAGREEDMEPYFSALIKEAKGVSLAYDRCVDTVYFGGGTPSCVDINLLEESVKRILSYFKLTKDAEITMECNPKTIDLDGLKRLRESGINRLSIGLQSACDTCLETLGRIHSFKDFCKCFENAQKAGFDNISVDLMYGLPDMTMDMWEETINKALDFGPQHISCYGLKIEEGTPFAAMNLNLPDDDTVADMYYAAVKRLGDAGYNRYEISNFSLLGYESRHNLKYWRCNDYVGIGAGAYSCIDRKRFSNICEINDYIYQIEKSGNALEDCQTLSREDQMSEFIFLGLRCSEGVSFAEFKRRFGRDITERFGDPIKRYVDWGFLKQREDRLAFTDKGFYVSNTILADFV